MTDALSIFAAAREAPQRLGLVIEGERFTFAQLAELTRARLAELEMQSRETALFPLDATSTLQTVVTLYALLERREPALLLHPKLTATERAAQLALAADAGALRDANAAAVIYTSGTTGAPRAAVLPRSAFVASARAHAANLGWRDDDHWLLAMSLARIGGLSIVTRCLIARRPFTLVSGFDAQALPALIEGNRITLLSLVPTMLALLLDAHPDWTAPPYLRAILLGGAMAPHGLLQRAAQCRLPIVFTYGMTETCSQIVATPYESRFDPTRCATGRSLEGVELRTVNGRIEVRGPMRMSGYLHEPPLAPDAWFDTGDLGELDVDGCLHVHARIADLIISGGENVYPAEVERVLERCPGVVAAGVFGVPDETWGQIVAAALVTALPPPSESALHQHIDAHLAPFKRPRRVFFVPHLPHTAAGKLDRAALAAQFATPR